MYQYAARLIRCIDGDTVQLDLDLGFGLWRLDKPYRLLRVDAPEMPVDGLAAKRALETFLLGRSLMAQTQKSDSFGRYLIELLADGQNVSDWLVKNSFARYRKY